VLPYALMLLATATWGLSFVVVKGAIATVPPATFLFWRFALATAVLGVYVVARRRPTRRAWMGGILMGLPLAGGYALQTFGLRSTGASSSGFLTGLYVVLTPLLAWLVWRRPLSARTLGCAATAMAGLALLAGGSPAHARWGDLLTVGCALTFSLHFLATERFAPHHDVSVLNLVQFAVASAAFAGLGAAFDGLPLPATRAAVEAVVFTALCCTVFGFFCQTWAQARMPAAHAALAASLEAPFAALFSRLMLGERLSATELVGCVLMFVAFVAHAARPEPAPREAGMV
jgi:drug/metabolite transporter (DMT)-like permease